MALNLPKNRIQTILEPLLELNKAKRLRQDDVSRKLEPSVFQNSSTFHSNPKYGVTKSCGSFICRKSLKNVKFLNCQWVKGRHVHDLSNMDTCLRPFGALITEKREVLRKSEIKSLPYGP